MFPLVNSVPPPLVLQTGFVIGKFALYWSLPVAVKDWTCPTSRLTLVGVTTMLVSTGETGSVWMFAVPRIVVPCWVQVIVKSPACVAV